MYELAVITGPTAVGKSAVALAVAQLLGAEIVSADSVQVYRGLDIGSAKPSPAERRLVPHHLLDIADPRDNYTVADYQRDAAKVIAEIAGRGKLPLLVGGTGLYLRAVVRGFAFTESGYDQKLRQKLSEQAAAEGSAALHARLATVDPETAAKLHPNDTRRIIRALEVYIQSGRPISEQVRQTPREPVYRTAQFCLTRPRHILYQRIEKRVDRMLAAGLVEEVEGLLAAGVPPEAKSMQSLGYKQIVSYLQGKMTLAEATELIKRETRRFAKRQLTWFRREKDLHWMELAEDGKILAIAEKITAYLAG
ncbi:MAG TPA: tRNA (adenosine(37)-N6)-dimethylallyltransferase MiaA [Firmicutes bacterium]|jgi:tRNA dimethylallyltransferase|nr:tRNA (adenosine(37)-N6)-dimethylallyltransferase MiaA [Bacillota bacterium]